MALWLKDNKLIIDGAGRAIDCDHCPCTPKGSGVARISVYLAMHYFELKFIKDWTMTVAATCNGKTQTYTLDLTQYRGTSCHPNYPDYCTFNANRVYHTFEFTDVPEKFNVTVKWSTTVSFIAYCEASNHVDCSHYPEATYNIDYQSNSTKPSFYMSGSADNSFKLNTAGNGKVTRSASTSKTVVASIENADIW